MSATSVSGLSASPAGRALGNKLDSIPFSGYHILIILALGLVGFVEGYDLALSGTLLVLAKGPLQLTAPQVRWLAVAPTIMIVVGGFIASAISDHLNRKVIMQIGVILTTFFTLLIPLSQSGGQLIVIRMATGIGVGFAISAAFPIAAELMPAQHRRTYGAIYEIMLASAFTLLPFVSFLLADDPNGFRLAALPGGLALFVVPVVVHFVVPQSSRWQLRRGEVEAAVDTVNQVIRRSGNRVAPLTVEALGPNLPTTHEDLPPFRALFARGQLRWTSVGIISGIAAGTAYYMIAVLLPKALHDQGAAVTMSFGISTLVFMATIPGKAFTAYLMEIIGRRWTIAYALAGSFPGLILMATAHLAGPSANVLMSAGAMITGFTVLSAFPATRVYLSEQFPTALRGRGHIFGEAFGRIFAGVLAPFLVEPYTGSAPIFFGTIVVVALLGAFVPLLFGKETVGQLETVAELSPEFA
ncbi:MAG TPA: MFS transporter [Acetobacteraceae bacterium]|nr:MFS transporter [Acetobacteraceae bacterium]